ncbi:MAG: ABC transporter ATP-binding protein [Lachnospiraceae bacterium]
MEEMKLCGLTKKYGSKTVVDDVNMTIEKGDFITILGPSGAGKTTVLKMISGFEKINKGQVLMDGENIAQLAANKRNFGMLFQNYALFPHMTVEENIAYPLKIRRIPKTERTQKVNDMLRLVELEGYNKRFPKQLSGGQQQRVALARSIVFNPSVLLLDEPMAALDKQLRKQMQIEIKKIHTKLNLTTISVTHDQEEALTMSNKVCVMRDGKICQFSEPESMYERPNSTFIANFIGESTILKAELLARDKELAKLQLEKDGRVLEMECNEALLQAAIGAEISLVIRPEKVKVVAENYTGEMFHSSITASLYTGDTYRVEAVTDTGVPFLLKVFSRGKYDLSVGAPLCIGFRIRDLVAVTE